MRQAAAERTRARRFLLASAALLSAVWVLAPTGSLPVYDGLPLPAEPYRYVDPPPGVKNPGPPHAAHVEIQLIGGGNSAIDLPTSERPPQAELSLTHGDIEGNVPDVPAVTTAEVRLTPIHQPDEALPEGRQLHGNVYDVTVVANGVSLDMRAGTTAQISLRQPKASDADPRIAVLADGKWQLLETHKGYGSGVLAATLPRLGPVALLEETSGFVKPSHHFRWDLVALAGLVLLAVAVAWVIRRRRRAGS